MQDHIAHMTKGLLESRGIPTLILNQKDSSYNAFGLIELYVAPEFEEEAKKIIEENNE